MMVVGESITSGDQGGDIYKADVKIPLENIELSLVKKFSIF